MSLASYAFLNFLQYNLFYFFILCLVVVASVLELWKNDLKTVNEKAAEALADPSKYPNLFPDLEWALKVVL